MDDLISRQVAIDALKAIKIGLWEIDIPHPGNCPEYIEHHKQIQEMMGVVGNWIERLKALPTAEPKWTPCSERLPDITDHHTSEPCIVYCDNGAYTFAELEENIFGQVGWNCERDDEYHEAVGVVLAWMPLPEPFKEESDEADKREE